MVSIFVVEAIVFELISTSFFVTSLVVLLYLEPKYAKAATAAHDNDASSAKPPSAVGPAAKAHSARVAPAPAAAAVARSPTAGTGGVVGPGASTLTVVQPTPPGAAGAAGQRSEPPHSPTAHALSPTHRAAAAGGRAQPTPAGPAPPPKTLLEMGFPWACRRLVTVTAAFLVPFSVDPHSALGLMPDWLSWALILTCDSLMMIALSAWLWFHAAVVFRQLRQPFPLPLSVSLAVVPLLHWLMGYVCTFLGWYTNQVRWEGVWACVFALVGVTFVCTFALTSWSLRRELNQFVRRAGPLISVAHIEAALSKLRVFSVCLFTFAFVCTFLVLYTGVQLFVDEWHAPKPPPPNDDTGLPVGPIATDCVGFLIVLTMQLYTWPAKPASNATANANHNHNQNAATTAGAPAAATPAPSAPAASPRAGSGHAVVQIAGRTGTTPPAGAVSRSPAF